MPYSVGFIGTGPDPEEKISGESFAQAYSHAPGYAALDECEIVACADLVPENAVAFADRFGIDDDRIYEDHAAMLTAVEPDVVSVCTPIPTHADLTLDCIRAGVDAVHCEKPMAVAYGDARLVAQEAWRRGVQLSYHHQRRFGEPFRRARALIDDGEIGPLRRLECSGAPIYETGIHFVDLCHYLAGETPVEWVVGAVDYREENVRYGLHSENQALAQWAYEDGVHGLAATGHADAVGAAVRAEGTEGTIEVGGGGPTALRVRRGDGWEPLDVDGESVHGPGFDERAIADLIDALGTDREPETGARRALAATETIVAAYESARRRGRVDLPLTVEDNPLVGMVESGALDPAPVDAGNDPESGG